MTYQPLTASDWEAVKSRAFDRFVSEVMPDKPTRKSVAKRSPEKFDINILEWFMMVLSIILFIFVGYKGGINALAYVDVLVARLAGDNTIPALVVDTFKATGVILFALMPSVAVIYFKILHDAKSRERQTTRYNRWYDFLNLDYWSPRLPIITVYLGIGWLAYISWAGETFFFLWIIPLVVEVASSYLVAKIIVRYRSFHEAITARYLPELEAWEARVAGYENERGYFRMLFLEMREALRDKVIDHGAFNRAYPNRELFDDPSRSADAEEIIRSEYHRWNAGAGFADEALGAEQVVEAKAFSVEDTLKKTDDGQYVPQGSQWTSPDLKKHLLRRGALITSEGVFMDGEEYKRSHLDADYASGYGARTAFRNVRNS